MRQGSEVKLVVDYWLYYVWNDYRVRGGLFPFWFDRSHPNDLEHIHLILKKRTVPESEVVIPSVIDRFTLEAVFSSAHEGTMPANRYYPATDNYQPKQHFMVELGAHAIAPDANKDGVFTPGIDGQSGYKLLWGIRDKGIAWTWYRASFTQPRSETDTTVFSVRDEDGSAEFTYQLVPADKLRSELNELALSTEERKRIFETRIHRMRRFLGTSNGEAHRLVEPPDIESQGNEIGLNGFSSTERGIIFGGTSMADTPGIFLGGRYGFLHGITYLPDLICQLDGILTTQGKGLLSSQFLLSYPISVATKVVGGAGLLTDSASFRNKQWDWLAGFEVRLGHLQIYAGFRSSGKVNDETVDVRFAYFF
jgi:hypothetical protein